MATIKIKTPKTTPRKKVAKKVTAERLRNVALYYLQRYASGAENLRQVLNRRVRKSAMAHPDTDMQQADQWIAEIVADMQRLGYVNDDEYARTRVGSLYRRGTSLTNIRQKLRAKGIANTTIESAIAHVLDEVGVGDDGGSTADLVGAIQYAKRRRIGVYRTRDVADPEKQYQRDMASLARNGFGWDICKRVMDAELVADLDDLL